MMISVTDQPEAADVSLTQLRRVRGIFIVVAIVLFLAENGVHVREHCARLEKTTQVAVPHLCHSSVQRLSHFQAIHQMEHFAQKKVAARHLVMIGAVEHGGIVDLQ